MLEVYFDFLLLPKVVLLTLELFNLELLTEAPLLFPVNSLRILSRSYGDGNGVVFLESELLLFTDLLGSFGGFCKALTTFRYNNLQFNKLAYSSLSSKSFLSFSVISSFFFFCL